MKLIDITLLHPVTFQLADEIRTCALLRTPHPAVQVLGVAAVPGTARFTPVFTLKPCTTPNQARLALLMLQDWLSHNFKLAGRYQRRNRRKRPQVAPMAAQPAQPMMVQ